jgi:hypothetical protein
MTFQLRPGEAFNPYRMFTGLFIPEGLAQSRSISAGAKVAWGRLARYAGEGGRCYPTVRTLGCQIGVGQRQAQKYLSELEKACLIRRIERFANRAQTSNGFEFLRHEMFQKGVNGDSARRVNDRSPKESQIEESHSEESKQRLRLTGCESQKARFTPGRPAADCKQYPRLREALANYMEEGADWERIYPNDRTVVDIMDAAQGAREEEVIACLRYFYEQRGLKPGTRNGPRRFAWFPTVVSDYFRQKRALEVAETAADSGELSKDVFGSMTEPIEIDGSRGRV